MAWGPDGKGRWFCLVFLVLCAGALAGEGAGPIWRVSGTGVEPSYLMGSVHVGYPELYPMPAIVREAYARSEILVVEADILAAPAEMAAKTAALGLYPKGQRLQDALGPEQWQAVAAAAEHVGLPLSALQGQKPWLAYSALTLSAARREGYHEAFGVDRHFLEKAHREGRAIRELEGLAHQLEVLAGIPEALQGEMLAHSARRMLGGESGIEVLMAAWREGDMPALQGLIEAEFPAELMPLYEVLVAERNRAMAERLDLWLAQGHSLFIVVGAAHVVGPVGLVALLRERGYRLERR